MISKFFGKLTFTVHVSLKQQHVRDTARWPDYTVEPVCDQLCRAGPALFLATVCW